MRRLLIPFLLTASQLAAAQNFTVHSSSVVDGHYGHAQFASNFGCSGSDTSPQVSWSGAPAGTKSYAVTFYDPDAPTGSGWWHWVVVNLPANTMALPQGASSERSMLPADALQTNTDGGVRHYNGICPPPGQIHRYQLTVYALKVDHLDLPENASGAMAGFMINMNSLAHTRLTVKAGHQ
jgi:Raf kinase inhibitor-like YbhB/YbcL family protein